MPTPNRKPRTVIDPVVHRVQSERSYQQATNPDRVAVLGYGAGVKLRTAVSNSTNLSNAETTRNFHSPDMRRVRAEQQAAAAERALAAEEERIARAKAERERKRVQTPTEERFEKRGGKGARLGDDGSAKGDGGKSGKSGTAAGPGRSTTRRHEPRAPPPPSSFGTSNQSGL